MPRPDIETTVLAFYQRIRDDPYHRFRSWEHCFRHFARLWRSDGDPELDMAALHLAFYLASWGMYRGSSFLLWQDYRVHRSVVKATLQPEFRALRAPAIASLGDRAQIGLVFSLVERLRGEYGRIRSRAAGDRAPQSQVSDILITKVMLGCLACIPAYDRLFKQGVREVGEFPVKLGPNSYRGLVRFVQGNRDAFLSAQRAIEGHAGFEYPAMKLADMYFWSIGYQILGDIEEGEAD